MFIDFKKYTDVVLENYDFSNVNEFFDKYKGNMGWSDISKLSDEGLLNNLKKTAKNIRDNCEVFLVIGIGGSYLGAKAVIDALSPYFNESKPEIIFIGNSLSSEYLDAVLNRIKDKSVCVNYISKSLKTLESTIAFEVISNALKDRFSDLEDRIIYTTSDAELVPTGYKYYLIPSDIGGRYSVFTPVGLLPMLVAGIDVDSLLSGAAAVNYSDAFDYSVFRNMMKESKSVEAFVSYEPKLMYLIEWLKQLFGESLGKEKGGLLPIGLNFTTDLHSLGQFIQEGSNILFETVLKTDSKNDILTSSLSVNDLNNIALISTALAHKDVSPSIIVEVGIINEYNIGRLMQFFMWSCAISGYIDNINPFDQNGVEVYKRIMNDKIKSNS